MMSIFFMINYTSGESLFIGVHMPSFIGLHGNS